MKKCNMWNCRCYFLWVTYLELSVLSGAIFPRVFSFLTQPQLRDLSNGHTLFGEDINLECTVISNKNGVVIQWNAPLNFNLTNDRTKISTLTNNIAASRYLTKSIYTISNSTPEDESLYYCEVAEDKSNIEVKYQYIWIPIYDNNDHVLKFNKEKTFFDQTNTEIQVHMTAHPEPTISWLDNSNKTISMTSTDFTIHTSPTPIYTNYKSILKFNRILPEDFGNYTIVVENKYERKTFAVLVNITGPPSTTLAVDNTDKSNTIKCESVGFPSPNTTWEFKECADLFCFENISQLTSLKGSFLDEFELVENGLRKISYMEVNSSVSGVMECIASNRFGVNKSSQYVYKPKGNFEVSGVNFINRDSPTIESLYNETVEIMCAVSLDEYYPEIKWYHPSRNFSLDDIRVPIKGFHEYHIQNIDGIFSAISKVSIKVDHTNEGNYTCKAYKKNGNFDARVINVLARELPTLNVASNMQNKSVVVNVGNSFKFYCNVDGYPTPTILWYKGNSTISPSKKFGIENYNQTLIIHNIDIKDNGIYKCEAINRKDQKVVKTATLHAKTPGLDWLLIVIICLVLALIIVIIYIIIRVRKERKLKQELKEIGLHNFEKGAIEHINPELRLDDQAELLPYDKQWEIPVEHLTLGKELGSGAFGVVLKGELCDFPNKGIRNTVAVKTVNKFAGHDCIKALASELKIMVHLRQHVNIVNLIGACTKDITKKTLMVVVEYCCFGNLQEYILYNSKNFIDQRQHAQDIFDFTIGQNLLNPTVDNISPTLSYCTIHFTNSDDSLVENIELQQKRSSTQSNEKKTSKFVSSQDFLVWSFQIAKGMEYLASRRVLHGDLAARNVLLAENNVVKIADFGLARNMYKTGIYKKKENGPLPVKWMALESIGENVFSTQSDVWSFGVVLWEIFSLAKTPYPGMPVDQHFYNKLFSGYRMEKPEFANTKIYQIMLDCWNETPTIRPSFTDLAEQIGSLLVEPVKNHYLDMNGSYVVMNRPQLDEERKEDYLSMMSPPTFENMVPAGANYFNNINYFHSNGKNMEYVNCVNARAGE